MLLLLTAVWALPVYGRDVPPGVVRRSGVPACQTSLYTPVVEIPASTCRLTGVRDSVDKVLILVAGPMCLCDLSCDPAMIKCAVKFTLLVQFQVQNWCECA